MQFFFAFFFLFSLQFLIQVNCCWFVFGCVSILLCPFNSFCYIFSLLFFISIFILLAVLVVSLLRLYLHSVDIFKSCNGQCLITVDGKWPIWPLTRIYVKKHKTGKLNNFNHTWKHEFQCNAHFKSRKFCYRCRNLNSWMYVFKCFVNWRIEEREKKPFFKTVRTLQLIFVLAVSTECWMLNASGNRMV